MKIGILGAGRMGQTLARLFVRAGHQVKLANSRRPESLQRLISDLGANSTAGTREEVARFGDVIIIATRWDQVPTAAGALWLEGKVVIDTTNNRIAPGPEGLIDLGGRTSSEIVTELVPGARLVKAFNHQPIPALEGVPLSLHRSARPSSSLGTIAMPRNLYLHSFEILAASRLTSGPYRRAGGCKAQAAS